MDNSKQAVLFGNFVNNFVELGQDLANNMLFKSLGLTFYIEQFGNMNFPCLGSKDQTFKVRLSQGRIDIEELTNKLDTKDTVKSFLEKVKNIVSVLVAKLQGDFFTRIALNGNTYFDELSEEIKNKYYKTLFGKEKPNANEWIIGDNEIQKLGNQFINVRYSIARVTAQKKDKPEVIRNIVQVNFDINTPGEVSVTRYKEKEVADFFNESIALREKVLEGKIID